jgi:hypothetical protein
MAVADISEVIGVIAPDVSVFGEVASISELTGTVDPSTTLVVIMEVG